MKIKSPYIYIIVVFLLAFSPIISFIFALKNDFFLGYFPPKFLLSETISSGQFPLWNPYISFGLPFYADMNGAYWNPITWLIALTTGYSAYTLTLELLFYVIVGGLGMYKLTSIFSSYNNIRLTVALAYMCNGFVIGHLQHLNWISCSAFLPWCTWGILIINQAPTLRRILFTVILFYFLTSSSHPGMIIGAIYFFGSLQFFLFYQDYRENRVVLKKKIKIFSIFFLLLILLSSGQIAGYLDIIPHFARSGKVDLSLSLSENTTLQSWISLLFPFGTVKNWLFFGNDIALRNNYFGLSVLCFFLLVIFSAKTRMQWFFLITGSLFFLLSLGGDFKLFALNYLPLIGYVRVNGEFRIFSILCFIITTTSCFSYYADHRDQLKQKMKIIVLVLFVIIIGLAFYSFTQILKGETIFRGKQFLLQEGWRDVIKEMIHHLSFFDTIFLQSIIQAPLLFAIWIAIKKLNFKAIALLTATDLILSTLLNLPFTGVGKVSVAKIYSIHQRSPRGIPIPSLHPIRYHDTIPNSDSALVGDWSFYNKQIGKSKAVLYPVKISNNYLFYQEVRKDSSLSVANDPYIFLTNSDVSRPKIINIQALVQKNVLSFSTNSIQLSFRAKDSGHLVLLQNYYPHWYYERNGISHPVSKGGICFSAIPIMKGDNNLHINFNPVLIKILFVCSTFFLMLYILLLLLSFSKKRAFFLTFNLLSKLNHH